MAQSARVSLFRRGKFWHLSFWIDGKRIKQPTGLTSKAEAELIRADKEKSLVLGQLHHLRIQEIPVYRCYREYLRFCVGNFKAKKTLATERCYLKNFFRWASVPTIDQLRTAKIQDYFAYKVKADKLVASSIRRAREALHSFFAFLKRRKYIGENPATDVKPPRIPEKDILYMTLGEIEGCMKAVEESSLKSIIACAIYSGLRREELCWLTWDDIDLNEEKPLIRIRSKKVGDEEWKPKTRSNRWVPVSKRLYPYLLSARAKRGEIPWVFVSPMGCRWDPDNLGHRLAKLMELVNLKWSFGLFRHTYGSQLAIRGVSIFKISKLMGNSVRIAERHYASLQTQDLHSDVEFGEMQGKSGLSEPGSRKMR